MQPGLSSARFYNGNATAPTGSTVGLLLPDTASCDCFAALFSPAVRGSPATTGFSSRTTNSIVSRLMRCVHSVMEATAFTTYMLIVTCAPRHLAVAICE